MTVWMSLGRSSVSGGPLAQIACSQPPSVSVYLCWDEDDELLYVGITGKGIRRQHQHAKGKPWWGDVATTTWEHYLDREDGIERERELIEEHQPRYNVVFNKAAR